MAQMAIEAAAPELVAKAQVSAHRPEQSLAVACLLTMSGGFLDAFTWLSLGGVFANSQTGNVVFLGMYAALGKWHEAAHHVPPIAAFLAGAWIAIRVNAPLLCLVGEIVSLATVMVFLPHASPGPLAITAISFGVARQTASFRQVERWKYLSVTVTGNMLRAIEQLASTADPEAARGARTILTVCLMFLLGAAAGGFMTVHLAGSSLVMPIGLLMSALGLCCRHRCRRHES
jgi:uncharacterized membrane protein YoaK (UPF0700 family)